MRIMLLKGFGYYKVSDISQYFADGYHPFNCNWSRRSVRPVMDGYTEMYGNDDYICIGFSDGATLAHRIAAQDERCKALIIHSSMFPIIIPRNIPTLMMRTTGDRTPTYRQTLNVYLHYKAFGITELSPLVELPSNEWLCHHQFANGLETIKLWCQQKLGFDIPILMPRETDGRSIEV